MKAGLSPRDRLIREAGFDEGERRLLDDYERNCPEDVEKKIACAGTKRDVNERRKVMGHLMEKIRNLKVYLGSDE